jgi:ketosteroid isomerase-like protein
MARLAERTTSEYEHRNLEVANRLWHSIATADCDALRALFSPRIEWTSYGQGALSGHFYGTTAALDLMARCGELVDELSASLGDVYASEKGAIIRYRLRADHGPRHLDTEHLLILEIDEQRITGLVTIPMDQDANDRFFALH